MCECVLFHLNSLHVHKSFDITQKSKRKVSYQLFSERTLKLKQPNNIVFAKPTTQQITWERQWSPVPPVCISNFSRFNTWEELEEGVWIHVLLFLQTEVFTLIAVIALKPLGAQTWNIRRSFVLLATQIQRANIYLCTDVALLRKAGGKHSQP